jgi:type IV pilus assembly protein PilN
MKDLNFFENHIGKSETIINKRLILYFFATTLAIILLFYTLFYQIKIKRISKDVNKLKIIVEDERVHEKIKEIKENQIEMDNLNKSLEKLILLDDYIEEESTIDGHLLNAINLKMPEEIFFTSISMNTDNIEIVGNSKGKWAIAQLGKGLETIEDFHEVLISNISLEGDYYNFILNIRLKDVDTDGEDSINGENEVEETDEK